MKLDRHRFDAVLLLGYIVGEAGVEYIQKYQAAVADYFSSLAKESITQLINNHEGQSNIFRLLLIAAIKSDKFNDELLSLAEMSQYDLDICNAIIAHDKLPLDGIMKIIKKYQVRQRDGSETLGLAKTAMKTDAVKNQDLVIFLNYFGTPEQKCIELIKHASIKLTSYIESE